MGFLFKARQPAAKLAERTFTNALLRARMAKFVTIRKRIRKRTWRFVAERANRFA